MAPLAQLRKKKSSPSTYVPPELNNKKKNMYIFQYFSRCRAIRKNLLSAFITSAKSEKNNNHQYVEDIQGAH